jgi:uncharacterized protein with WD repeat
VDTETGREKLQLFEAGTQSLQFSPLSTYFVTASKFNAQTNPLNLVVWNLQGDTIVKFEWKKHASEAPAFFKFTDDQTFCARQSAPNRIEIYPNSDFTAEPLMIKQQVQKSRKGNPKVVENQGPMQFHGFQWVDTP